MVSAGRRRSFQRRALSWYAANARDLPWRRTRDPYAILVSEILSHQTQIGRVVPVYEEVLRRYPTATALAAARLEHVKAITDPLGYKVRGAWLHGAALQVRDSGGFPQSTEALRRLPGVGPYTAAAIMSFAHRADVPAIDTNVARVLARHFGLGASASPAAIRSLAEAVTPAGKSHLMNQALMDIGAAYCRARSPRCTACPLKRSCSFRRGS